MSDKNQNYWDSLELESTLFYKWDNKPTALILLDEAIENYEIVKKTGTYGDGIYIAVKCPDEVRLFNIKSIKMRKAILEVSTKAKKFPIKIELTRVGFGKSMDYKAKIVP